MTRFARAQGSKSSNEKLPEEATSWNVMKRQLQDKLQSNESVKDGNKSIQKIWKSSDFDPDAWDRNNTVWAEFEGNSGGIKKSSPQTSHKTKKVGSRKSVLKLSEGVPNLVGSQKKSKKRKWENQDGYEIDKHDLSSNKDEPSNVKDTVKAKKKKLKQSSIAEDCDFVVKDEQANTDIFNTSNNFNKTKKRKLKIEVGTHNFIEKEVTLQEMGETTIDKNARKKCKRDKGSFSTIVTDKSITKHKCKIQENESNTECVDSTHFENSFGKLKNGGRKKKKSARDENKIEEITVTFQISKQNQEKGTEIQEVIVSNDHTPKKKKHKQKHPKDSFQRAWELSPKNENFSNDKSIGNKGSRIQIEKKMKTPKWQHQNDKTIKKHNFVGADKMRKKRENWKKIEPFTVLHMNGRDIEIVKFDGFPVKREDAENLKLLKQKLIANGVPLNEIKATMKLERRKAEKALAREKKKVCFHCRKSGHVLSECPELGKTDTEDASGTGICFKCGSTEHKYFECRVTREQEFRFAKCFICEEQGHIARQCPDNPRGLYPKGGGCHVCGDVTHLKKDCPDLIKEKEQKTIRLPTLSSKSLEVLEDDKNSVPEPTKHSKKKKTIKF